MRGWWVVETLGISSEDTRVVKTVTGNEGLVELFSDVVVGEAVFEG